MTESVKLLPRLKKRTSSPKQKLQPKVILGEHGEARAVQFFQKLGYQVLDRNLRVGLSEVDIVCFDPAHQEIVFVEVKTRSQNYSGSPSSAVKYKKRTSMKKVAWQYLKEKHLTQDFRFDIVSVLPETIEHFINITW